MKNQILIVMCLLATFPFSAWADLNDGLVAYYPFTGNANDVSGNGHNGTIVNAVLASDRFGNPNACYSFNGINSYIPITNSSDLSPIGDFSVSVWLRQNSSSLPEVIISKSLAGDSSTGWFIALESPNWLQFQAAPNFETNSPTIIRPPINGWNNAAFTFTRNTGLCCSYLNGILVDSRTRNYSSSISPRNLTIGAQEYVVAGQHNYFFSGQLDGIRIYNRVLSASEIQQLYSLADAGPVTIVQTNRAPTTNEVGRPTIPTDPTHFKVFTNGTFQSGITLDPTKMTIVLTHGWNSSPDDWAGYMSQLIKVRLGASTPNIVAWDWQLEASTPLSAATDLTQGEGYKLGTDLITALGANYSRRIHFMGHSLGTFVNAAAANCLEANGYSWTNIQMTLFDEAEIAWGSTSESEELATLLAASGNFSTPQPFWNHPLPKQCAWADNYISAVGLLHPEAANVILTYLFPTSFPDRETFINEFYIFHSYPYEWYDETIQTSASLMGFQWSFESGGFANAPATNTFFFQNPNGPELSLAQTNFAFATNFLNSRLTKYIGAAEASFAEIELNGFVQTAGQVTGAIDNAGNMIINLFTSIGSGSLVQSSAHPLGGPIPNGGSSSNSPAYAWIPLNMPSNVVSMSFDFMLQGNSNNDSFQAALNGTNILSLETILIQTNVTMNSGLIDVSQYVGTNVELFLGIVGGTSTNAQLTVSDIQFYSAALPSLQAQPSGGNLMLSWPLSAQNFSLQTTTNLADTNSWTTLPNVPAIVNLQNAVTNPISGGARFYRLKK